MKNSVIKKIDEASQIQIADLIRYFTNYCLAKFMLGNPYDDFSQMLTESGIKDITESITECLQGYDQTKHWILAQYNRDDNFIGFARLTNPEATDLASCDIDIKEVRDIEGILLNYILFTN